MNILEPPSYEQIPIEAYEELAGETGGLRAGPRINSSILSDRLPTIQSISGEPKKGTKSSWSAELTLASSIIPQPINWLWCGWIARGKLTVLAGSSGGGKTTLAIGLIGTLTSGGRWPDGEIFHEPGNVLIWSSEDDPADTLVPRLMAAGANLERVYIIQGRVNANGEREPFDPATDFDLLRDEVTRIGGVALILLDPVVNVVRGDMHRANDVRRALQVVVDFAAEHNCAVLGISHFSKGSIGNLPAERVIGSQAFSALARTVLVAAKQEGSDGRVLARAKSNISDDQGGVSYTVEPCTVGNGLETTRVLWGHRIEGSARDILAEAERIEGDSPPDDDPTEALRRILSEGPLSNKDVQRLMTDNGYTQKQTRTAREKLAVEITREGYGKDSKSIWSLLSVAPKSPVMPARPQFCPLSTVGTTDEKGHNREGEANPLWDENDTEEL